METARFSAQKLQRAEPSKNHKARKMKKMAGDFSRSYSTFAPESERCPKIRQIKTGKISRPGTTAITLRPELTAWKETKRDRRTQRGGGARKNNPRQEASREAGKFYGNRETEEPQERWKPRLGTWSELASPRLHGEHQRKSRRGPQHTLSRRGAEKGDDASGFENTLNI